MLTPSSDYTEYFMPSLNHSYICLQLLKQFIAYEHIEPLPELTLDIGNGITPDIAIFPKTLVKPNQFNDITRIREMPLLAIEVISSSQTIRDMLQKARDLVTAGVMTVWTVEPYSRTVFITNNEGERMSHESIVTCADMKINFLQVFP